jgi:small-conductance mechanosensitive channel
MKEFISVHMQQIIHLAVPLGAFLVVFLAGLLARKIIFRRLVVLCAKTSSQIDDIVIAAIKGPFVIWCLMLGIYCGLKVSVVPGQYVIIAGKTLLSLGILSVTLSLANIAAGIVQSYSSKVEGTVPVTSLTQNITRLAVIGIGVLFLLNNLGISITPILATLGVGGLAVALALQDTLANLFSGFHIIVSRQIKVGDFIRLESGEEGYVFDITWRNTRIRMLQNNVVLIPNAKLSQAVIVNYHLPDKEMIMPVNLGVHYNSDLDNVEKVTIEVGREVMKEVQGAVPAFEPVVRFHSFGESSIDFSVVLRVKEFSDQGPVKHEFIKRLAKRYAKEGIVIPYPIRAINTSQEK